MYCIIYIRYSSNVHCIKNDGAYRISRVHKRYVHSQCTYVSMYACIHICPYMHIRNMEEDWLHCSWMLPSAHVCSAEGFNLTVNCLASIHVQSLKSTLMNYCHVWYICTHVRSPNTSSPAPLTVRDWAQCHTAHLRGSIRNIACNRRLITNTSLKVCSIQFPSF